jgi:hypothetical protein
MRLGTGEDSCEVACHGSAGESRVSLSWRTKWPENLSRHKLLQYLDHSIKVDSVCRSDSVRPDACLTVLLVGDDEAAVIKSHIQVKHKDQ